MEYFAIKLSTIMQKKKMRLIINNHPILMIFYNGNVYAIRDKCPHMGAMLSIGTVKDGIVSCKDHGLKISVVTGEVVDLNKAEFLRLDEYSRSVRKYKIIIKEESVYIEM